ncbi:malectin domain-containing carbohydrate-binding protein [Halobaculum magnesiiphilum]|uniref:Choice-of-anchor D domain-containing protein n=1 Tax=Halobaculum magnesiiphilum TaxID=1017351 RepID=A0A8T8WE34_9EURY|nr:malectin domain-containing carbohydrate-binding protein [Halobaculum magnesiiphilum]QZP38110.1 choice-of-anchor D domain-containing protein [Halobaculum magnesiiphilum]
MGRKQVFAVLFAVLTATSMAVGTVAVSGGAAAAAPGDVVYRVNAGGSTVAAADGGPDWAASDGTYVSGGNTYSQDVSVSTDASVPGSTPTSVFTSEVYGNQEWTFSENIQSGQQYEVRLYFAEIFHGVDGDAGGEGDRVFDVSVEGETVLDGYDIYADVGAATGTMQSFTVTPEDGEIDVDLATEVDNAKISAIEIVEAEPQPDTLGGPSDADFGSVVVDDSATETVTVTNLGADGDGDITITDASVTGTDAGEFSVGTPSQTTLAPGESADVPVTFSPSSVDPKSATLEVTHDGSNSPLTVDLAGEATSATEPSFDKSTLEGFSAGNPTAIEIGPDGRVYVSTQGGTVYALSVERTGDNSYEVVNEVEIDAIEDIPNHDDLGNLESGQDDRQITGLTVGGTAENPVVYVSSSDPEISVGQDDDTTDTNSGAISRLTIDAGSDETLQTSDITHEVLVLGLPRSEENHATNGLDLSADGDTLYAAQGGHTNKGAPGDNFGHTPEYALSAAILEIDLAQIEGMSADSHQTYDSDYPDLPFYYALPTIGDDEVLPFGGDDGANQAELVEDGPVQIYSPGYRNPYDLVVAESGQVYVADHGPNGGWGGQPADQNGDTVADAASVTNHPNEDGSYSTSDQLVKVDEGDYGGHPAPIRANPTGADLYDANGDVSLDITESNSPVPESMVDPRQADYIPPTAGSPDPGAPAGSANTMEDQSGNKVLFAPTGGTAQYTASNFGGAMEGDLLQVELGGSIKRVELSADGSTVTNVETVGNTNGPLGISAQDDDEVFGGTIWIANHGGDDITVFEPADYGSDDGDGDDGAGDTCTGADDASLDEDGDGYDNADEIDAGTDPCSASSTPVDFDDDGTSNLNDPDDDNDGLDDTEDPFAVDPDNGLDTTAPVQHDLSELSLFGENGQGWTGVMTNGQDYQDLYDPTEMTVGGAAEVLTVEEVPQGDAYAGTNTQQYGFQFGVDTPDEPFVVETTVASFPENPEDYQSAGLFIGTGDQSNYVKLVAAADGGDGGVEFAQEVDDSFDGQMTGESAVTGNDVTLRMTVEPTTDPAPNNGVDEVAVTAEYEVDGTTTEVGTTAMPASWLDTSDGVAPAVGIISTSNGASSTFPATWTQISVDYVNPPANEPPTADAGADQTVEEGTQATLDASGSQDPDGDQLGYTWTQTDGQDVDLSVNDGEQTTFTAPDVGSETTLTFQVSVSDGQDSDADSVNVTVQPSEDEPPAGDGMTVAEAVALGGENDSQIENAEIQQAISWWSAGSEVPDTGGETITNAQIQQLINYWSTDAAVGDDGDDSDDGDDGTDTPASATIEVTPDTGTEASTYGGGSFTIENTGDEEVSSVTFDLSSSAMPDVVFDPNGTAGDSAAKGLNIDSESGDGVGVVSTDDGDVFSQPHNGVNGSDGYDVMTVEFDDFDPGESVSLSVDNDPTSIKDASLASQEAGPISGLELARSTVSVEYGDGGVQETQLFGDGSAGGAQATLDESVAPAPSIDVQDVDLDDGALRDHHGAATVSDADQTVTVSGEPGETVTLLHFEGELELTNVPEYDGTPGYDIDAYEANKIEQVDYETVTLDSNGEAEIPVTLLNSTDVGGYNYLVATHGEPGSDTGLASNVVVLKYEESAGDGDDDGAATSFAVNAGGDAYTAADGTEFQADTNFDGGTAFATGGSGTPADPEIANTDDDELYHTERYGDFSYDAPLADGTYEVTLHFAELYQGVANDGGEGDRLFDVSIEGQQVLDEYDIYAEAGGEHAAITETVTVEVTDGELNVDFSTVEDNAKVSAIEVEPADGDDGGDNAAPTIGSIADQTVTEGDSANVSVDTDDPDGDPVSLSVSGPDFVAVSNGEVTVTPASGDAGTYTVDVTADDGNGGTATESFQLTVEEQSSDDGASQQVLHRVNAGEGETIPATDDGPDWTGVADTSSPYLAAADGGNYGDGTIASTTANVPASTPDGVWDAERYGNMTWEFAVDAGEDVEVRLYLGNSFSGASEPGDRQFNVSIEGQQVLTQYDPVADVGHATGTMKSFTVTEDGDGTITVVFEQGAVENPEVRAIEILGPEDSDS